MNYFNSSVCTKKFISRTKRFLEASKIVSRNTQVLEIAVANLMSTFGFVAFQAFLQLQFFSSFKLFYDIEAFVVDFRRFFSLP